MTRLDAVIFDMDGTLIDSAAACPDAYIATFAGLGGPALTRADIIGRYHLGPPPNILADALGRPATRADIEAYHANLQAQAPAVTVYEGVVELLDELADAGVATAVFTGASTESAHILLAPTGLVERFSHVLGSDLVERPKPDPAGLWLACERLGVDALRAAYVGDSPLDQQAARAAGCVAVSAAWGHLHDPLQDADLVAPSPLDVLTLLGEVPA